MSVPGLKSDAFRAHLGHADDGADRLFERLRDLHVHVGHGQAGHFGDDGDARERDLRVDAARHPGDAVNAAGGEQGGR
jgi:hypothetical protein